MHLRNATPCYDKQTIASFNRKKAPGTDGITSDIYLRTFNKFPRLVTEIYNQCLERDVSHEGGRQQKSF